MSNIKTKALRIHEKARALLCATAICWFFLAIPLARGEQIAYMDFNRQWHEIDASELTSEDLKQEPARARRAAAPGQITFNVIYQDVTKSTGEGFDHPTVGALRRATLEAVLAYINSVLYENGTCDIVVEESLNSGSNFLATAGPIYHYSTSSSEYFLPGDAFEHITTGIDPGSGPDIRMTVDFGFVWNSGTDPVSFDEVDLFSVLLHELTHGLGILSLSGPSGQSQLSSGRLTTFDDFLYSSGGVKLWNTQGVFQESSSVLTGGNGSVLFRGPKATTVFHQAPAVYTPSPYEDGSSVAHWDDNISPRPVMRHSVATGAENRSYQPFEIAALEDLGYDTPPEEKTAPSLSRVTDVNLGRLRLFWASTGLQPAQFLGLAYDIYLEEWATPSTGAGIWQPFSNTVLAGDMTLAHAGAYHVWISSQFSDGSWLVGANPATTILKTAPPHRPLNPAASALGNKSAQVSWKPDLFGAWSYWILTYNFDTKQWVKSTTPRGENNWQYVVQGESDFFNGSTQISVPSSGQYFFFIAAMAWDAQTLSEFASAYVNIP